MAKNFNEVLKEREIKEKELNKAEEKEMSLDSTERVKVLSPGQLVFKRFVTNKLSIVGTVILVFMFLFSFVMPLFYPYSQTQIFYKYDNSVIDYAQVKERTDYTLFMLDENADVHYTVKNKLTASINTMKSTGEKTMTLRDNDGVSYRLEEDEDFIYSLYKEESELFASASGEVKYATYSIVGDKLEISAGMEEVSGFSEALKKAIADKAKDFTVSGVEFKVEQVKKTYNVYKESEGFQYFSKKMDAAFEESVLALDKGGRLEIGNDIYSVSVNGDAVEVYKVSGSSKIAILSTYVFDTFDASFKITKDFEKAALQGIAEGKEFAVGDVKYTIKVDGETGEKLVLDINNADAPCAAISTSVIRRYNGEDTLEIAFKEETRKVIAEMAESGKKTATFTWPIAQVDSNGEYSYDESGNLIKEDREITITDKNGSYVLNAQQVVYLIDTFAAPSSEHWIGTDSDGMDVLSRMMYGGRVSLMVAFVVVILETILGIIMGGVAGFFGGWVDNIIMRMVDIFYCIPSMPILIIMGAMFDALKMKPYIRLTWMMAILGILGWAGVARLVRGQILSLREQEFMVAAEAIGLKSKRRIFKHLIPNVMPQLIVTATSGLGSVIITESTLSFLGLGVKHPLASWGTMINSVSTAEAMKAYTYIWVPVGLLICLTVIAFNFVGDGLRDAFDPKMKR
ncbi:MAG: ABC transporter permease [Lachnospiraceae bacterium]|nr:ABC transporter permease [Lachnospiraceae bacterium]